MQINREVEPHKVPEFIVVEKSILGIYYYNSRNMRKVHQFKSERRRENKHHSMILGKLTGYIEEYDLFKGNESLRYERTYSWKRAKDWLLEGSKTPRDTTKSKNVSNSEQRIRCACGGEYNPKYKWQHFSTKQHKKYMQNKK